MIRLTTPTGTAVEGHTITIRQSTFAGRPLGLCFDETHGDLYIADAYMGLLRVGPHGGLATKIVTHAQGIPLRFTNSLDIDQSSGAIYFTDSSSQYQRRWPGPSTYTAGKNLGTFSTRRARHYLSVVLSGDRSGRLMKYDPASKQVEVLVSNLAFPNGVALSKDGSSILLAETTSCRILREKLSELLFSYPWTGNVLLKLPFDITKLQSALSRYRGGGFAVRLGENGDVLEVFEDDDGKQVEVCK
ncbi:PROTEIN STRICTOSIDINE SYNTHASE-LIKE 2 [Salix koriyanagi]|uniref:PROTEIN STRICTOSIDINE SYNTHASE-LIKE 2 n=1 Tax=Salix koriyanagi TaxID=2511006 RepID=A0A9Q0ZUN1_9ROSI|nr:PROTEIN STRICTOSIDINE SYNTHASE-LIKE 2 [Salix koriyanagi]